MHFRSVRLESVSHAIRGILSNTILRSEDGVPCLLKGDHLKISRNKKMPTFCLLKLPYPKSNMLVVELPIANYSTWSSMEFGLGGF